MYAVERPDGEWSVKMINKDRDRESAFIGKLRMVNYGAAQFRWRPAGADSHAGPDLPPVVSTITAAPAHTLPKASIIVLRGRIDRRPAL